MRKILNFALLLIFLPTATTSVFLYLGYRSSSLVFWHNQLGMIFLILCFLHLLTYIKYFKTK